MKDKLMSIFVAFVRKTFIQERILDLVDDLLDVVYDRFAVESSKVPLCYIAQVDSCTVLKGECKKDV